VSVYECLPGGAQTRKSLRVYVETESTLLSCAAVRLAQAAGLMVLSDETGKPLEAV